MAKPKKGILDAETMCFNGMEVGHSAIQGYRVSMEDAHIIECFDADAYADIDSDVSSEVRALSLPDHTFLSMLDGHGGAETSLYVSTRLSAVVQATPQFKDYVELLKRNKSAAAAAAASAAAASAGKGKAKGKGKPTEPAAVVSAGSGSGSGSGTESVYSNTPEEIALLSAALVQAYVSMDEELQALRSPDIGVSGSTAVSVIITPSHIICANVGDSRCVVGTTAACIALTEDHKPTLPDEQRRIVAAGGFVADDRVNGELAMSRALGDFQYKTNTQLPAASQAVTCYPDISVHVRDAKADTILILACDGVWDVMNGPDAVDFIVDILLKNDPEMLMENVARNLALLALRMGSSDNISAIVANFRPVTRPEMEMEDSEVSGDDDDEGDDDEDGEEEDDEDDAMDE
jgi:serine/threonine protein phosphatase PrpC